MKQQNRIMYIPPLVLDYVELETESPILAGSGGGEPISRGEVITQGIDYAEEDFSPNNLYNNEIWY